MRESTNRRFRRKRRFIKQLLCLASAALMLSGGSALSREKDFTGLTIEELMGIQVTSVSKKIRNLSDSAAAIFVITNDDLKHAGVTSIAEALRMVPGLTVARIDANKWAVNSRSATSRFSSKLLVLMDGRSVYTPSFSGVYWEVQDTLLEDVERIEVIRGPGATLWGANAVNGVINIITKHSADTLGGLVSMGGGNRESAFASLRYGFRLGEGTYGRWYAKAFERDEFSFEAGGDANDDWNMARSGFRMDTNAADADSFTLQGDIYSGNIDQSIELATPVFPYSHTVDDDAKATGGNLLGRWRHTLSPASSFTLQVYYDTTHRKEAFADERRDSFDLDFQHEIALGKRHDLLWGARYRTTRDNFSTGLAAELSPRSRRDDLFSLFFQDEIMIVDNQVWLTLGSKFEHNDYTGYEVQPSARILFTPRSSHKFWAAISRAVRTPSRLERDARVICMIFPMPPDMIPVEVPLVGNPDFDSEELMAYEIGYRFLWSRDLSIDLSGFYNDYDNLNVFSQGALIATPDTLEQPYYFSNASSTRTYGGEVALAWQATKNLKLNLAYGFLDSDMEKNKQAGREPRHQVSLRTAIKLRNDLDLDLWLRHVDKVTVIQLDSPTGLYGVNAYTTLDLRLAWRPVQGMEVSLVGQNLLDSSHMEFIQEDFTIPTEVKSGIYGKITCRF
ncbi:MAG: TonB-dependent receptor [Desulfobacteraceae bacterium]|nr:TonB-dependent receptor [Desulfobacteraceae bacterium]